MAKFLKRPEKSASGPAGTRLDPTSPIAEEYPALWEHLTLVSWEDGGAREPSSLTVFYAEGLLKACLSDKEAERTAFVSAGSFEGLLLALEHGLQGDSLDWRRSRAVRPGSPKGGR